MVAPKFKVNDIAYIAESAALGELDAFRIGALRQQSPDVWVYQIIIDKKPPSTPTAGDRIDLRYPADLFYRESELLTFCEALDDAILNVQGRINKNLLGQSAWCESSGNPIVPTPPAPGAPKYEIGEEIFIRSSANIGFLESYKVSNIHSVPETNEFTYQLELTTLVTQERLRSRPTIYFKERELFTRCEALTAQYDALQRKMSRLLAKKVNLCGTN